MHVQLPADAYRHALALLSDYDKAMQNLSPVLAILKKACGQKPG